MAWTREHEWVVTVGTVICSAIVLSSWFLLAGLLLYVLLFAGAGFDGIGGRSYVVFEVTAGAGVVVSTLAAFVRRDLYGWLLFSAALVMAVLVFVVWVGD